MTRSVTKCPRAAEQCDGNIYSLTEDTIGEGPGDFLLRSKDENCHPALQTLTAHQCEDMVNLFYTVFSMAPGLEPKTRQC
ncbi:hypothetical protein TNCV_306081 [Trichonephila clavipes]|nr:hypothetical protein TNCV_306081 [Trichonephila clavipes]